MTHDKTLNSNPLKKTSLILLLLLFIQCSKDTIENEEAAINHDYLLSSSRLQKQSKSTMGSFLGLVLSTDNTTQSHDIEVHRIVYKTKTPDGKETNASGVVMFPRLDESLPLISYQHGTITEESSAPSNITSLGLNQSGIMALFASTAMIVSMPDYLGYGASSDLPHPYEHRKSLATASYDMLKAVEEFLEVEKIKKNNQLYLMGYSEGGYATLAMQKHMEASGDNQITASMPGAGAYNKTAFTKTIVEMDQPLEFIASYLWVLHTYNQIYNSLKRPWSDYLNEPYAQNMEGLDEINAATIQNQLINAGKLETNPTKLFKESWVSEIINGSDTAFLNVLEDNDLLDWTPKAPVFLYHGTQDDYVFPLNSSSTAQILSSNGGNVSYVPLEGKDHDTAVYDYFNGVFAIINE
jgi:pimeloyl-ACP methyl ester carboxylesterase